MSSLKQRLTRKVHTVQISGEDVNIRPLSLADRDKIRDLQRDLDGSNLLTAHIVVMGCPDLTEADIEYLVADGDSIQLNALRDAVLECSGLGGAAVEEAVKNSESDQSNASSTA